MKNKLLLVSAIVVGILIIGVILKNFIKNDLKKNDPLAYDLTYGTSSNSETKPEVKLDSTDYWRAESYIDYQQLFRDLYYFKDKETGNIFTSYRDIGWGDFHKAQYEFDYKKTGDLIILNYAGRTEYWVFFNINTLVDEGRGLKLRRVDKKVE
jgi:hypothetical protein